MITTLINGVHRSQEYVEAAVKLADATYRYISGTRAEIDLIRAERRVIALAESEAQDANK